MTLKFLWVAACLTAAVEGTLAQGKEDSVSIRNISDEIFTHSTAYENLRVLTKTIGGRVSGSPQMYKAEAWGVEALKAAGADSVWLQDCMVPKWVRGGKETAVFEYAGKKINLDVLSLGNSIGTGGKLLKAPVVLINSFEELERRKDELNGKIVFYNYKFNPTFVRTFQAYGDASKYRAEGPARAARYGAVAVLVRSMSHSVDNNPHTGTTRYVDSLPKIPALAVGLRDADALAAILKKEKGMVSLKSFAQMLADTLGHNVIGELRGTQYPDQFITIGGHLDSWDPAEGAHDDGTGCVHSIEVLRALKATGYKPRYTIRIVLFANEENGLRGGTAYAEKAKAAGERHYFALESDAGGFTPRGFGFTGSAPQLEKLKSWLPLLQEYGVDDISKGGGGADIGPLNRTFGTPLAGLQPDPQRYFDIHHARSDVFEAVNKRELELGAIAMTALIYLVDRYGL